MNTFAELRAIDVSPYVEKKAGQDYLSWAWAVDLLLQRDPSATWEYRWGEEFIASGDRTVIASVPYVRIGLTAMVFCTVRAFGVERTAQLAVVNHQNKPIQNPDSFQLNTTMQRCLAKAIALHGIGLSVYRGEDVTAAGSDHQPVDVSAFKAQVDATKSVAELHKLWPVIAAACNEAADVDAANELKAYCAAHKVKLSPKVAA